MPRCYLLFFLCLIFSCKGENRKIKTVVILGNSIVRHPPKSDIGWYGNWGMAASSVDSDFVHILIRNIKLRDSLVTIKFENIADFERDFMNYDLSKLDSLINPDLLILKISENFNDKKALDSNFIFYYDKLIKHINQQSKTSIIIVDGFWDKQYVNSEIKIYAQNKKFKFVTTTDLSTDSSNEAGKVFNNPGVSIHPSNKGMRLIAKRIWDDIENLFE